MSIITRTGDNGTTGLMYNRRVPKTHPRVNAYGVVDELNAVLGLARASAEPKFLKERLLAIQKELVIVMGELAILPQDLPRYSAEGFKIVTPEMTASLEKLAGELEERKISPQDWAMPGGNPSSAALDFARTVCRRADRQVWALKESGQMENTEMLVYLNRLSALLWRLARWAETAIA